MKKTSLIASIVVLITSSALALDADQRKFLESVSFSYVTERTNEMEIGFSQKGDGFEYGFGPANSMRRTNCVVDQARLNGSDNAEITVSHCRRVKSEYVKKLDNIVQHDMGVASPDSMKLDVVILKRESLGATLIRVNGKRFEFHGGDD